MEILLGTRGCGKTRDLVYLAAKGGFHIVVFFKKDCDRVYEMARYFDLQIPYPITYEEYLSKKNIRGKSIKGFLFDEPLLFLESKAGNSSVKGAAIDITGNHIQMLSTLVQE